MKKITLLIAFVALLFTSNQLQAQIDIDANWPNPNWETAGAYSISGLISDPSIDANFGFNDNAAGSGSLTDAIGALSPVIDITSASTATPPQNELVVSLDYVFRSPGSDVLTLEWYDQSTHLWNHWETFTANSANFDYVSCSGMQNFTSQALLINGFTIIQKIGFRYRFVFNDTHGSFGFCFGSPTIQSQEAPLCVPVSGITADNINHNSADINWVDNNVPTPANGWEIEYGDTGFTQGSGTTATTTSGTYAVTGLNAESCYDVYVRSLCSSTISSTWVGPFNFCTVAAGPVCGGHFYDSGGSIGDYQPNENITTTINPAVTGEVVTVLFTSFNTENNYDGLMIYDGPDDTYPLFSSGNSAGFNATTCPAGSWRGTTNVPTSFEASLANGGSLTFVFRSDSGGDRSGWETNIFCGLPTTCFMTENLAVNNPSITITGATVTWSDTNIASGGALPVGGWMIEYGAIGFDQGTGTTDVIPLANGPTYTFVGLSGSTEYDFYIKAVCGANEGDDDSFWSGPVDFMTLCEAVIVVDLPSGSYSENFENGGEIPNCWEQGNGNNKDWMFTDIENASEHFGNGGTSSGTTLSNNYFAWVDDTDPNSMNTTLISPFFDLTGLTIPTLGFWLTSHNELGGKNVNFSIDIWDGTTLTQEVFTQHGNSNGWENIYVDLAPFANQIIQIRFIVDEINTTFRDDFAIDDIFIGNMPSCINVNAVSIDYVGSNTIDVSWTDGNIPTATAWEIEYGAPGFTSGTGTSVPVDSNPFTVSSLIAQTDYEFYIRAVCGTNDYSLWAGPLAFTTLCEIFDAPYTEDFEDAGVLNQCWTQNANLNPWLFYDSADIRASDNTIHFGNEGTMYGRLDTGLFAYIDDSEGSSLNTITSPLVNVSTLAEPSLSFYYISHNENDNPNVAFSVDFWDGAQWNNNVFFSNQNTQSTTPPVGGWYIDYSIYGWKKQFINLDAYTITGPVQVRFSVNDLTDDFFEDHDDLAIDNVTFDEAPCFPVSNIIVSNITQNSINVSWADNNTNPPAGGWDVEIAYSTLGQGSLDSVVTTVFTPNTTITGLLPSTYYDVFVTANCTAGSSEQSQPLAYYDFNTQNGIVADYNDNDICTMAIELPVTILCEPKLGNNSAATATIPALATDCSDPAVDGLEPNFDLDDVWYKFTMPVTATVIIETRWAGHMDDSAISIYKGNCGNLAIVDNYNSNYSISNIDTCSDDADADLSALTISDDNEMGIVRLINQTDYIGEEFYIRVWSVDRTNFTGGENIHGQFSICVIGQPIHTRPTPLATTNDEIDNEFNLTYYPNPVTDTIHLNSDEKISEVRVYSVLGQEVIRKVLINSNKDIDLNVENLETGTYFVKVKVGNKTKTVKIIKI